MLENLPKSLRYILEVYRLVHNSYSSRINAINEVARKHRITSNSVTSACTRDVQLKIDDFDYLLKNPKELSLHLVQRFPNFQKEIEQFINSFDKNITENEEDAFGLRTLFPEEKDNLLRGVLLKVVIDKLTRWLTRNDLPINFKTEIEELKKQLEKA